MKRIKKLFREWRLASFSCPNCGHTWASSTRPKYCQECGMPMP